MRRTTQSVPVILCSLLGLAGCGGSPDALSPSQATTATCNVALAYLGNKILTVAPSSTNNNASWHIINNGTTAVTLSGQALTKSGAVTAVRTNVWATFPYTLAGGTRIDADLRFDVGASGTGSVGMTVSSSCGSLVLPAHPVTIQTAGIPFGLFGIKADSLPSGTIWTGSTLTSKSFVNIRDQLAAARAKSPRLKMWFNMTSGDEQVFKNPSTGAFMVQAWKDTLDNHAKPFNADGTSSFNVDFVPYINDGTFQGHMMLDDLGNFASITPAQIDSIAAYSKRRFPTLLTAVRERATVLKTKSGGAPYTQLDVGWAQYRSDRGSAAAYRDAEILAATQVKLGLILGINITDGGPPIGSNVPTDSLLSYGSALLAAGSSDYACGFMMWNITYSSLSHPNMTTLANLAKNHVSAPCRRR